MNRYEYSVLDVAMSIAERVRGTGGGHVEDAHVQWLRWRVTEGWEPEHQSAPLHEAYDIAVRTLAIRALALWDGKQRRHDG